MKRITSALLAAFMLIAVLPLVSCVSSRSVTLEGDYTNDLEGTTLYVYNWGEYISDGEDGSLDINAAFEDATGIHVEYNTYDSNESMYAVISSDSVQYDIVIPSDYMVERLIAEDRLEKINFSKLSNYKYIDEKYKNPSYDPTSEYSIPYAGGYLGLIYNNTLVDPADVEDQSWSIMWNEKYRGQILGINNARDAFAIAMFSLGIDVNTTDQAEWDRAADYLSEAVPLYQGWAMDQTFTKMEGENAAIAAYYAGDYLTMVERMDETDGNGDHLSLYYPREGTNVFFDACCILKGSQNYEAALLYLNFLMEPSVALENAEYIHYTCPNTAVTENEEYSEYKNEILYPTEEIKAQYYSNLDPETIRYYDKLWNRVKNAG